jgi:hypothetical protein
MQTNSKGENVPDIQSLAAEVSSLRGSVNGWNTVIVVMMVVAAIAAIGLVATQFIAFKTAERLADKQVLLSSAKDKQLALELKDKDDQIAKANARGEEAKLETVRLELALAKVKTPRRLTQDQRAKCVAGLKEFSGTAFDISASIHETLIFALDIEGVLTEAGWDRRSWTGGGNVINLPGRTFVAGNVITQGVDIQILDPGLSKARDALVNALRLAGFEGVIGSAVNVPPEYPNRNVMHINVGTKP